MMEESSENNKNISGLALLQGQVVLITGASRGIGAATALLLARHGAAIGVNYHRSAERAREVVEAIRACGGRAIAVQASVDNAHEVEAMVQQVEQELGPHGIRVNVVAAGAVETEASAPYLQAHKEAISQALPLRRIAQPEDIAAAILLLAMPQANYLTGNYLAAGGGNYLP